MLDESHGKRAICKYHVVDQLLISSIVRKIISLHSLYSGGKDCIHVASLKH